MGDRERRTKKKKYDLEDLKKAKETGRSVLDDMNVSSFEGVEMKMIFIQIFPCTVR